MTLPNLNNLHETGRVGRVQIQNHADIIIAIVQLKAGNIANPNLIWPTGTELLLKNIPFLLCFPQLQVFLLCGVAYTNQTHFTHDIGHKPCANFVSSLYKNCTDFLSTECLVIFIEHITYQYTVLLPAFFKPGISSLIKQNMVVKCASRNH